VKHTEHFDGLGFHEIRDPIMPIQEDANVALRALISLTQLREIDECLGTVVDPLNCFSCGSRIVLRDVLEDAFEPTDGFFGPD
jgi:hypothetical protein